MTNDTLKDLLAGLRSVPSLRHATWLGLREGHERRTTVTAQDGHLRETCRGETRGVLVEVFAEGHLGYAATSALHPSGLRAAAERALTQAETSARHAVARFAAHRGAPHVRPASTGRWRSAEDLTDVPVADVAARAVAVTRRMQVSPRIVQTRCAVDIFEGTTRLVSTSGTDVEQWVRGHVLHLEATTHDAGVTQRRSDGDALQGCLSRLFQDSLVDRAERVATQALELLTAAECPTACMDLLLLPSQMTLQIHESIGHPLELDRILGDERNYAGWSFVRREDFGTLQYGSPLLNVTFDPTVHDELASYGFDDGGAPTRREHLIRQGVLLRALGGLESQERAGVPGVANVRASGWNRPAVDRMANLNVEPGDATLEELVSSVRRGVIMDTNRSWSIDDYRNKFQFGCEYGRLIEEGRVTRTVRNPNYRGMTTPFWNALKGVGDASTLETHGSAMCGKAEPNQLIRVGHRSPPCLFQDIEVFGGAA